MNKAAKSEGSHRGGKREGAGRPPSATPRKQRPLKASDTEWQQIKNIANVQKLSVNEYIIRSALAPVKADNSIANKK